MFGLTNLLNEMDSPVGVRARIAKREIAPRIMMFSANSWKISLEACFIVAPFGVMEYQGACQVQVGWAWRYVQVFEKIGRAESGNYPHAVW